MKQTIIALGVLVLLAACRQNADEVKTENDATAAITGEAPVYESLYISETEGNTWIQNYHKYLRTSLGIDTNQLLTQQLSFMIDARKLKRYLDDSTQIKMLNIYLARTSPDATGLMTLVYVGAKDSIVDNGEGQIDTFYVEQAHYKASDPAHRNPKVMDHAYPCPTCEERVHVLGGSPGVE
ncbi:MAG TPA: hypothetical protein VIN07_08820 [Flavipsychrobacter sp.]